MTISERICCLLDARYMGQKEFSELTGIAQSTISDWNWKKTDPVSEKIVIICEDLGITLTQQSEKDSEQKKANTMRMKGSGKKE